MVDIGTEVEVGGVRVAETERSVRLSLGRILAVVEVGSTATGTAVSELGDDLDLTVIRAEPLEQMQWESVERGTEWHRTAAKGERSRAGDLDVQLHTIRKFVHLCLKGDASTLAVLYAPCRWSWGSEREWDPWVNLRDVLRKACAAKSAGRAYLGFAQNQYERWMGERGQKGTKRPELVERFGYDVKYAAHVLRLAWQGCEFMRTGKLTIPLPNDAREMVLAVRRGEVEEGEAATQAELLMRALGAAVVASELPQWPDQDAAYEAAARAYQFLWQSGVPFDIEEYRLTVNDRGTVEVARTWAKRHGDAGG